MTAQIVILALIVVFAMYVRRQRTQERRRPKGRRTVARHDSWS